MKESKLFDAGYTAVSNGEASASNLVVTGLPLYGMNTALGTCSAVQGTPNDGGKTRRLVE